MTEKVIFSGCDHELEHVIADMACPVCMKKEIERLQAKIDTDHVQHMLNIKRKDAEIERLQDEVNRLEHALWAYLRPGEPMPENEDE